MKKIIITIAFASFISLGFTLIKTNTDNKIEIAKTEAVNIGFEKVDLPVDKTDKRLASWD